MSIEQNDNNNSSNTNQANCSNLIYLADHIDRRRSQEIQSLLTNDRNILKIMHEDIEQRVQFLSLQYDQLNLLVVLKEKVTEFAATKPDPNTSIEPLLTELLKFNLPILSFSMHHALVDCLESLHRKEVIVALPQIECITEDLFNLQEKKLLIAELQLSKVEEIIKLHYLHYRDIIDKAGDNPHIPKDQTKQELDNLVIKQQKIAELFEKQKNLKQDALKKKSSDR